MADLVIKKCRVCGVEARRPEELDVFKRNRGCSHGREAICKPCHALQERRYRAKVREPRFWSQEDIAYLIKHASLLPTTELATTLNRNPNCINHKRMKLGLPSFQHSIQCHVCEQIFKSTTLWHKYCSDKCRRLAIKNRMKKHWQRFKAELDSDPIRKESYLAKQRQLGKKWRNSEKGKTYQAKRRVQDAKMRRERVNRARAFMGNKCWLCDYSKYKTALEFHHVNGRKFPNQKYAPENPRSKRFRIENTMLICSNCHQAYHRKEEITEETVRRVYKDGWKKISDLDEWETPR